jgi:hypothetical protein
MSRNYWKFILMSAFVAGSLLQIIVLLAVYEKGGGTSGADPYFLVIPFAVLLLLGLYARSRRYNVSNYVLAAVVIVVGLFGCVLPFWLEQTGCLVQYDRWLRNNQFPNTENLLTYLLGFIGVEVFILSGTLLWNKISTRRTRYILD